MSATKDEYGFWRYQKVVVHPTTGEKKRLRKRGFKTKRECELAESQAIVAFTNEVKNLEVLPLEIVMNQYLESKNGIKASSYQKFEGIVNMWIRPYIGGINAFEFTSRDAEKFYSKLLDFDTTANNKNTILKFCSSIFKYMEIEYGISALPITRLKKLKVFNTKKGKFNVYDENQFETYISTFDETNDYEFMLIVFFNVLIWTGIRRGEAKGLTWEDIWFESNEIDINKQFTDKHPILGRTLCDVKTETSIRTILTDNVTMSLLRRLKEKRMLEPDFDDHDFIFKRDGQTLPLPDSTIDRINKKHASMANLKIIRIHDFRHSFASINFGLGADVAAVSRQLGHSSVSITMDIYISMLDKHNVERVELINEVRGV